MSVDISQLTANLDPQSREAVKTQYEERAVSPTATFLLCFFLGSTGAHRFYLREWRPAFAHLGVFVLGAAALVAGLVQTAPVTQASLSGHPVGVALDVIGIVILLVALIWEIIDLGRIDHQVYHRNLLLAEGIIAGTLLADHSVIAQAQERVSEVLHHPVAPVAATAAAAVGVITAEHVADARALAEESTGRAGVSYHELSQFNVSGEPEGVDQAEAAHQGNWTETTTTSESASDEASDAPMVVDETTTRMHLEDGAHTTDSYEVERYSHPSAGEIAGLGAAGLGAAALGASMYESEHHAGFDEPTQPDAMAASAEPVEAPQSSAYEDTSDFEDMGDVTDAFLPAVIAPAADVAELDSSPAYVQLPEEEPAAYDYGRAAEPAAAEAPLYLIPEEETAPASPEPSTYAPIYDPSQEQEPVAEPAHHDDLAAVAGVAGLAGAGALGAEAYAHEHAAEPVAEH
ncbi:MAG TPA: TM2 domain-containing protein, partial [Ktedonobacterales bacterium]